MDRASQFREAAAEENRGRQKNGWRYSKELRAQGADYCRRRRQSGSSLKDVSEDLGVSTLTLSRWLEDEPPIGFRPVELIAESAETGEEPEAPLSVITPGGLRIEGLVWSQVMELTRIFR